MNTKIETSKSTTLPKGRSATPVIRRVAGIPRSTTPTTPTTPAQIPRESARGTAYLETLPKKSTTTESLSGKIIDGYKNVMYTNPSQTREEKLKATEHMRIKNNKKHTASTVAGPHFVATPHSESRVTYTSRKETPTVPLFDSPVTSPVYFAPLYKKRGQVSPYFTVDEGYGGLYM